jgi:predicted nucleic acid-binding protein
VSVPPQDMGHLVAQVDRFGLDFDDAYQYMAAEQSSAVIVSFDGDFDRTDRGRQAPADVLAALQIADQ